MAFNLIGEHQETYICKPRPLFSGVGSYLSRPKKKKSHMNLKKPHEFENHRIQVFFASTHSQQLEKTCFGHTTKPNQKMGLL